MSVAGFRAEFEHRADGSILVQSPDPLTAHPSRLTEWLEHWAAMAPDRTFLAERDGDGWRRLTFAETLAAVRAAGQALLDRGLSPERPLAILSPNSLDHAVLMLAALHVGVPTASVSTAYAQGSGGDYAKLRHCLGALTPGLVFAPGERLGAALRAAAPDGVEVAASASPLLATLPTPDVDGAAARVGPDTVAKILFTSGSTGQPKGVITTQRMLCSNQQMLRQAFPVLTEEPPVLLDWLPWSHTFGGSHNLGLVLANGGSLYLDEGRPVPGQFAETVRNLREIAPTLYFNVPKGYEELARHLDADPDLRQRFFSRVRLLFYAAASLPQPVWDHMDRLAVQATGTRIQWMTGLGSTETAPFALSCRPDVTGAGNVGLPSPGMQLKLAPLDGKLEARVRGPNVTPGYWRDPAQTAAAFDAEGFFRMGDALVFADPDDRQRGFRFDGRVGEDFKLVTGTWVSVGPLRARLVEALSPWVRDLVIAGLDRDYLAVLAIPATPETAADLAVRAALQDRLDLLAAEATGSSTRIRRLAFLTAPLSIDAGELTDKGTINQRGVLRNHAPQVHELYAHPPPPHVLQIRERTP